MTPTFTVPEDPRSSQAPRLPGEGSRRPVRVTHDLRRGGLLELERLAQLAEQLPAASIEHNVGALPAVLPGGEAPRQQLPPAEIVRTIETNGCWMVLKNVESDPEYAALLDSCIDALAPRLTPDEGPSVRREAFVFLSAPGSVTPTHIDPEHNVLLQVMGTKTMSIGRFASDAQRNRQAQRLNSGQHRNLDESAVDVRDHPLEPGDGIYVPVYAPHVVRNGPTASVSLSVTWRTRTTLREARVHSLNGRLHARGTRTFPGPGRTVPLDVVAAGLEQGLRLAASLRRVRKG